MLSQKMFKCVATECLILNFTNLEETFHIIYKITSYIFNPTTPCFSLCFSRQSQNSFVYLAGMGELQFNAGPGQLSREVPLVGLRADSERKKAGYYFFSAAEIEPRTRGVVRQHSLYIEFEKMNYYLLFTYKFIITGFITICFVLFIDSELLQLLFIYHFKTYMCVSTYVCAYLRTDHTQKQ